MLTDINAAIEKFIKDQLNQPSLSISFNAPDSTSSISFPSPTVNIFLYDIREDLDLRNYKPSYTKLDGTLQGSLVQATKGIAFSYIITVWSSKGNITDEPIILSSLIDLLLYCPHLPESCLSADNAFKNIKPFPKIQILHPYHLQSPAEFWNVMGSKPKPMIHLTVTVPAAPNIVQAHPITSTTTEFCKDSLFLNTEAESKTITITGAVYIKTNDQQELAKGKNVKITCTNTDRTTPKTIEKNPVTTNDGYFSIILENPPDGTYFLTAIADDFLSEESGIEIKHESKLEKFQTPDSFYVQLLMTERQEKK